ACRHQFVYYWIHNGCVRVDDEKMSKSLGNFFTIREVLEKYDPEVLRLFIIRAHYRSPLNYSDAHLDDARGALTRLYTALKETAPDDLPLDWNEAHALRFAEAMNDDFNTPLAISVLFELATEVNRSKSPRLAGQLKALAGVIGLLQRAPQQFLQGDGNLDEGAILAQVEARTVAKKARNFAEADRIRADLLTQGIVLEDKPGNVTEWRRA
ncbi:MAG: DALR domain-containing protein, partial [Burkholderiaceae bacterium]|nr:DALR domain-containing protein [Burkholderiaceae bacterium]